MSQPITPQQPISELFELVKDGRAAINNIVDEWMATYEEDSDEGLVQIIQFFVSCAGCSGKITKYSLLNLTHQDIIRQMTEEFDEDSSAYPLIQPGPTWKRFKTHLCDFVQSLVKQSQHTILYDQKLMDNVISMLTGLTDSQVRAFRHTSTLIAMKFMTALVDVALALSVSADHTQRQYDAEKNKNESRQSKERLDMLLDKKREISENQEIIHSMLNYIFKGVFVHRYRDSQPDIRSICLTEIGVWMRKHPNMFLDDSYLKYVGWSLYDKVGSVRLCCIKALQSIYEDVDSAIKLELFTNRFKDRLVEMTLDKEYEVSVAAVQLVTSIARNLPPNEETGDHVLSDKDCENVYELVYSAHRGHAAAAGAFLNLRLLRGEQELDNDQLVSGSGKIRSKNTPMMRDLVQFFLESELHEHATYLVDSLYDCCGMLRDYACMTDLLLEEPGLNEEPLDDRQENALVEIMTCAMHQATTGEYPVGRGGPAPRKLSMKEAKQVAEEKSRVTEHFITVLPLLLAKYSNDADKLQNLLTFVWHFDFDMYTSGRHEQELDDLLSQLSNIVQMHTDDEVLQRASKVLSFLVDDDYAIARRCQVALSTLVDALVDNFARSYSNYFDNQRETSRRRRQVDEDSSLAYNLAASMKRLHALWRYHDLNSWPLWQSNIDIVKIALRPGSSQVPDEIVVRSLYSCHLALVHHLVKWEHSSVQNTECIESIKMAREKQDTFLGYATMLLDHMQERVQEDAFLILADSLMYYSSVLKNKPPLAPLFYEADRELIDKMIQFLQTRVFILDEEAVQDDEAENLKIEELHKRRKFLSCFCKLIVYNCIPVKDGAIVFQNYIKFYNDYGDIIKATLAKAREINKVLTARTLAISLSNLFKELQSEQGSNSVKKTSDGFQAIKELARRFALSFGLDNIKNRFAVSALHQEGISFALNVPPGHPPGSVPPNLAFLETLTDFSGKLVKQDKRAVVEYLDRQVDAVGGAQKRTESWSPVLTYRNSLVQGEHDLLMQRPQAHGKN